MLKAINLKKLVISLLIPILVGVISSLITRSSMEMYDMVQKPFLSPPKIIFPIVWSILFIMMGISLYGVTQSNAPQGEKSLSYIVFLLQLLFNFLWPVFFFNFQLYTFSAVWLFILILLIALNAYMFFKLNKWSGYLLLPYLAWCIFALYLNIGVAYLN